jgi:CheY-like chemotaxis protein
MKAVTSMAVKILIVEDDPLQVDLIFPSLVKAFHRGEIKNISTEHEFRARLDEISNDPPDVVVMDVMLRWTDPAPDMPVWPDDVRLEGHYLAGIRCSRLLAENNITRHIPVILYTVLTEKDLEHHLGRSRDPQSTVCFLQKNGDAEPLIQKIRELIR